MSSSGDTGITKSKAPRERKTSKLMELEIDTPNTSRRGLRKDLKAHVQGQLRSQLTEARQGYHRAPPTSHLTSSIVSDKSDKGELALRELRSNPAARQSWNGVGGLSHEEGMALSLRCSTAEESLAELRERENTELLQTKQLQEEMESYRAVLNRRDLDLAKASARELELETKKRELLIQVEDLREHHAHINAMHREREEDFHGIKSQQHEQHRLEINRLQERFEEFQSQVPDRDPRSN